MSEKLVENHPFWSRRGDAALVNSNKGDYENFLKRQRAIQNKDERIASLEEHINNMSNDIDRLQNLVIQLLNKGNS